MESRRDPSDPSKEPFDLEKALGRIRHWLPAQGPIKDFVHHNTLHAFQHLGFHEASRAAARLYGARLYMPGEFYWDAFRSGEITKTAFERSLANAFPGEEARRIAMERMLSGPIKTPSFAGISSSGLRAFWNAPLGDVSLERLAHPPLFRLIGGYLDQGLSTWRMPGADRYGFFEAVASLVESSWLPLYPYSSASVRKLLGLPAKDAAHLALRRLVGSEDLHEAYLLESLLAQPGWAGLVNQCEQVPSGLLSPRNITLADYAAITLITELGCLEKALGEGFRSLAASGVLPVAEHLAPASFQAPDAVPAATEEETLLAVWQEALEWSYYSPLLGGIASVTSGALGSEPAPQDASSWAFFCIDDRECSLRRHVEESDPGIVTFATAGFFGLDFMYRGAQDAVAAKHCPVPVTPRHLIVEELDEPLAQKSTSRWGGFGAMLRLAASVLRPSIAPILVPPLSTVSEKGRMRLTNEDENENPNGIRLGYTTHELAERVQSVLQSAGTGERWPKLIVFFGHGSSSVNNPYFAAYNCGACSGRPGSPNARAFAHAANLPQVRRILRSRGIRIPDGTWFLGALHDTSLDEVTYYDTERLPEELRESFESFRGSVDRALAANASERCRRFATVSAKLTPDAALIAVRNRAVSLFEPRPEYNHATNASCIVGRRKMTDRLFLDRRAFLSSYDPTLDRDGKVLADILSAVVPVCGGINLEYYFSRVDPNVYGAGSKLPQNVTGLIGVLNGIEGDLLTGLPTQMTEIHDPVRLVVIVEQSKEIALDAARKNPMIFEWVKNGWVHYACIDLETADVFWYRNERMRKLDGLEPPRQSWKNSLEAGRGGRGNLPIGLIGAGLREKELQPC